MYHARLTSIVTACLLAIPWLTVSANTSDFQINADGTYTEQSHPRVTVAPDGTLIAIWLDYRNGNGDIYLQRFTIAGEPVSIAQRINSDTLGGHQVSPSIAADQTGQFTTVWLDYRNGTYPLDPEIYLQRLDTSVTPSGSNRNLTASAPDSLKSLPDVALSPFGGGVVVWEDYRNKSWDIWGQRIASNGAPVGSQFKINDDIGTAQQHAPRVSYASDGWFVVTWYDNRWGDDDIFVQRFDSLGARRGGNIRVSAAGTGTRQAFPDIAADDHGHFTVVWVDWRNGTYPANPDIYARRFDTMLVPEDERKVNTDGSMRAQRSPSIAADRRGNVAIVWADSGTVSWDIVGQMIDADGLVRETNFRANTVTDSAQIQPDVAVDGRNRYVVWADKRNGHFDIYASVFQYNDPRISAAPATVQFGMPVNGSLPDAQTIFLQQFGYNPIHYQVISSAGWLNVTPSTGVTPDTISISVTSDTLPAGLHSAVLTIVDVDNGDSSCAVMVRLEVQSPQLDVIPDTLAMSAFSGVPYPVAGSVTVGNAGTGTLTWTAAESTSWLELQFSSGSQGESLNFTITAESLAVGTYLVPIEVSSTEASNSPETAWVSVQVVDGEPYIACSPDTVVAQIIADSLHTFAAVVTNLGTGELNWTASGDEPWMTLHTVAGVANDTMSFSIDPQQLTIGVNAGAITITDSSAFNVNFTLLILIDYAPPPNAVIQVGSDQVMVGGSAVVPIGLLVNDPIDSLAVVLSYDTVALRLDSITIAAGLPDGMAASQMICEASGVVMLGYDSSEFSTGAYALGSLYFTALVENVMCPIDSTNCAGQTSGGKLPGGAAARVSVEAGEVLISSSTDIDDGENSSLPSELVLYENYPNPFNPNTVISFDLPQATHVNLQIFNLLGQLVAELVRGPLPAGHHVSEWQGRRADGGETSSGVYFYRLQAGDSILVRKMVLLK